MTHRLLPCSWKGQLGSTDWASDGAGAGSVLCEVSYFDVAIFTCLHCSSCINIIFLKF